MTTKLEAIRAREQAATPGPWEANVQSQNAAEVIAPCPCCGLVAKRVAPWDAEFIANSRADIPLLLSVAEAAAEEYAAQLAYLDAYSVIIETDADADAFIAASARFDAASEALFAAIAPLMEAE